ncbi:MAG: hypothetical protein IKT00_11035 [Prevotella sp.]|nr:hypothetical protein [Prevotella sp.]
MKNRNRNTLWMLLTLTCVILHLAACGQEARAIRCPVCRIDSLLQTFAPAMSKALIAKQQKNFAEVSNLDSD